MDKAQYVKKHLPAQKAHLAEIAFRAGVTLATLYNIIADKHKPQTMTINALYAALKAMKK